MQITLKPELQRLVEEQIRAGHFASAEDMVEEALARLLLDREEELDEETLKAIEESDRQIARGEDMPFHQAMERLRQRYGSIPEPGADR